MKACSPAPSTFLPTCTCSYTLNTHTHTNHKGGESHFLQRETEIKHSDGSFVNEPALKAGSGKCVGVCGDFERISVKILCIEKCQRIIYREYRNGINQKIVPFWQLSVIAFGSTATILSIAFNVLPSICNDHPTESACALLWLLSSNINIWA